MHLVKLLSARTCQRAGDSPSEFSSPGLIETKVTAGRDRCRVGLCERVLRTVRLRREEHPHLTHWFSRWRYSKLSFGKASELVRDGAHNPRC